jgi:hypothetical protein
VHLLANEISVSRANNGSWLVSQRRPNRALQTFRLKVHALAFARAVAHSRGAPLYVHDVGGTRSQECPGSLTYPVRLD